MQNRGSFRWTPTTVTAIARVAGRKPRTKLFKLPEGWKRRKDRAGRDYLPENVTAWLAEQFAAMKQARPESASEAASKKLTDAFKEFVAARDESDKPHGRSTRNTLLLLAEDERLAKFTLGTFTQDDLSDWCQTCGAKGATLAKRISAFGSLYTYAKAAWKLKGVTSPALGLRAVLTVIGHNTSGEDRMRRPTPAEITMLKEHFARGQKSRKVPWSDLIDFAIAAGARQGEVCMSEQLPGWYSGLRWVDLNEKASTILIRKRKHPRDKHKNDQTVPLLPEALAIILRQPRTSEFIFPYSARGISVEFTRAKKLLGIIDLHWHDLRREATSRMAAAGWPPERIMDVTGHHDYAMLRKYLALDAAEFMDMEARVAQIATTLGLKLTDMGTEQRMALNRLAGSANAVSAEQAVAA